MRKTYPSERQPVGQIRELCLIGIKRPDGVKAADLPCTRTAANQNLRKLKDEGLAFSATDRIEMRYFDCPKRAAAWLDRYMNRKEGKTIPLKQLPPKGPGGYRPGWGPSDPVHITSMTKVTIAPKPPQPTHSNTYGEHG